MPSLVEIGLHTATRDFGSSRWAWPVLVLPTCHNVWQFNEVQLRHLLIDFGSF